MSLIDCTEPLIAEHKRGDTWQPLPFYVDVGTDAEGLAFWSTLNIQCDLRKILPTDSTEDVLLAHAQIVKGENGWFYPTVPADATKDWVVGQRVKYDIQLDYNGQIISTQTFYFNVIEDETHA